MKCCRTQLVLNYIIVLVCVLCFHADCFAESVPSGLKNAVHSYVVDFGDDIAIRCLPDGSIEATVEAYDEAEWKDFEEEGDTWATHYTDEEYRAYIDSYESVDWFQRMQAAGDYIDVSAQCYGTLAAVHADGTVEFNKRSEKRFYVQSDDEKWQDIRSISLGNYAIIALRNDGTVITHGEADEFITGIHPSQWRDVVAIDYDNVALGLRADGRVYYSDSGYNPSNPDYYGPEDTAGYVDLDTILEWTDIVQVANSWGNVAGLKRDGTVVFAGYERDGNSKVAAWTDIVKIAVGEEHIVGLRKDGTLVSTKDWALESVDGLEDGHNLNNVVDVYANRRYTLAILEDGSCRLLGRAPQWPSYDGAWPAGDWVFPVAAAVEQVPVGADDNHAMEGTMKVDGTVPTGAEDYWVMDDSDAYGVTEVDSTVPTEASDVLYTTTDEEAYDQETAVNARSILSINAADSSAVVVYSDGTLGTTGTWYCFDGYDRAYSVDASVPQKAEAWRNVRQAVTTDNSIFAVKTDGTVVHVRNDACDYDLSSWSDIVQIAASDSFSTSDLSHVVGLRRDGTVVAKGSNNCGQCIVSDWTNIVQVGAGYEITVGLKSDGTIIFAGDEEFDGAFDDWKDIVDIDVDGNLVFGLKKDGTVHAVSRGKSCEDGNVDPFMRWSGLPMQEWSNVCGIAVSRSFFLGAREDGTVYAYYSDTYGSDENDNTVHITDACDVSSWTNIADVVAGGSSAIGIRRDGTLIAVGFEGNDKKIMNLSSAGALNQSPTDAEAPEETDTVIPESEEWSSYIGEWDGSVISYDSGDSFNSIEDGSGYALKLTVHEDGSALLGTFLPSGESREGELSWEFAEDHMVFWAYGEYVFSLYQVQDGQFLTAETDALQAEFHGEGMMPAGETMENTQPAVEGVALTDLSDSAFAGIWKLELLGMNGMVFDVGMVGGNLLIYLNGDGSAQMSGEVMGESYDGNAAWYIEGEKAYLVGNDTAEMTLCSDGSLMLSGKDGEEMYLTRYTADEDETDAANSRSPIGEWKLVKVGMGNGMTMDAQMWGMSGKLTINPEGTITLNVGMLGIENTPIQGTWVSKGDFIEASLEDGSSYRYLVGEDGLLEMVEGENQSSFFERIGDAPQGIAPVSTEVPFLEWADQQYGLINGLNSEASGGTGSTLGVNSNLGWSVQTPDWVHAEPESGVGDGSFTIYVDENLDASRSGEIIVSAPEANSIYMHIEQAGAEEAMMETQKDDEYAAPYVSGPDSVAYNTESIYTVHADGAVKYIEYLNGKANGEFAAQQDATVIPLTFMSKGRFMLQFSAVYADGTESEKSEKLTVTATDDDRPEKPLVQFDSTSVYAGEAVRFSVQATPGAALRMYQNNRSVADFNQTIGADGTLQFDYTFNNPSRIMLQFSAIVNGVESELSNKIPVSVQAASRGDVDRDYTDLIDGEGTVVAGPGTAINYTSAEKDFIQYLKDSCKPGAKQSYGFENEAAAERYAQQYIAAVRMLNVTNAYAGAYFVGNTSTQRATYVNEKISEHLLSPDGIDADHPYQVFRNLYMNDAKFGVRNIVFFFDGCSNNCESGSIYTRSNGYNMASVCVVVRKDKNNLPTIAFVSHFASTIPCHPVNPNFNDNIAVPTVMDGVYSIQTTNHTSASGNYAALKLILGSNDYIRCRGINDYFVGTASLDKINIHTRTGWKGKIASSGIPNSQGCFNIGGIGNDYSEYNKFMNVVAGIDTPVQEKERKKFPMISRYLNRELACWADAGIVIVDRKMNAAEMVSLYGKDAAECLFGTEIEKIDTGISVSQVQEQVQEEQTAVLKQFPSVDDSIYEPAHDSSIVEGQSLILKWKAVPGAQSYKMKLRDMETGAPCFANADGDGFIEIDKTKLTVKNNTITLNLDSYLKKGALQAGHAYNIFIRPCAPGYAESNGTYNRFTVAPKNAADYFIQGLTPSGSFTAHNISTITVSWQAAASKQWGSYTLAGYEIILQRPKGSSYVDYAKATLGANETQFVQKLDEWVRIDGKKGIAQNAENEHYQLLIYPRLSQNGVTITSDDAAKIQLTVYAFTTPLERPTEVKAEHNSVSAGWFNTQYHEYIAEKPIKLSWQYSASKQNPITEFVISVAEASFFPTATKEAVYFQEDIDPALREWTIPAGVLEAKKSYDIAVIACQTIKGDGYETERFASSNAITIKVRENKNQNVVVNEPTGGNDANNSVQFAYAQLPFRGDPYLTQDFQEKSSSGYHAALDIKDVSNSKIYSIGSGKVITVKLNGNGIAGKNNGGSGNGYTMLIEHRVAKVDEQGNVIPGTEFYVRSFYAHLKETFIVDGKEKKFLDYWKAGTLVDADTCIGEMGNTGASTGPHLHFAMLTADSKSDTGGVLGYTLNKIKDNETTITRDNYTYYNPWDFLDRSLLSKEGEKPKYVILPYGELQNNAGTVSSTQPVAAAASSTQLDIATITKIGLVSAQEETTNADPAKVSTGDGDNGGVSYGLYQFAGKNDTPKTFAEWLTKQSDAKWKEIGKDLLANYVSKEDSYKQDSKFSKSWITWGSGADKQSFADAQTVYQYRNVYLPKVQTIAKIKVPGTEQTIPGLGAYGTKENTMPLCIHQMLWARFAQGAPSKNNYYVECYGVAMKKVELGKDLFEGDVTAQWIWEIYWEASKIDTDGSTSLDPQIASNTAGKTVIQPSDLVKYPKFAGKLQGHYLKNFQSSSGSWQANIYARLNPENGSEYLSIMDAYSKEKFNT